MRVTITTIAQAAGVSRGTVDKVIHDRKGVSDEVRQRVKDIIERYDYRPNQVARALTVGHKPIRLAAIVHDGDIHISQIHDGIMQAAQDFKDYGLTLKHICPPDQRAESYQAALEQLKAEPPDGIVSLGVSSKEVVELIGYYAGHDVPVVLCDSDVRDSQRLCYVGENHVKSGQIAGALLAKVVGRAGEVAVIGGLDRIEGHHNRLVGFQEVLALRYPGVSQVEVVQVEEDNARAYTETTRVLQEHPGLKGIFVRTGTTSGVARAVVESGKSSQVRIVGYNLSPDIAALVNLGIVDFTIGIASFQQGYRAVETLFRYLYDGIEPGHGMVETPIEIAIAENMDNFVHS